MTPPSALPPPALVQQVGAEPSSIGVATMEADGTIVLRLRAEGRGTIGEGLLRYPPSHPQYQMIRNHLAGLQPGTTVPVPPFP